LVGNSWLVYLLCGRKLEIKQRQISQKRYINMPIFIALYFDVEDKLYRMAGVYTKRASAERRITRLGNGCVQTVTLNKPVRLLIPTESKRRP